MSDNLWTVRGSVHFNACTYVGIIYNTELKQLCVQQCTQRVVSSLSEDGNTSHFRNVHK